MLGEKVSIGRFFYTPLYQQRKRSEILDKPTATLSYENINIPRKRPNP
jgi:hypothetical protein